MDIIKYFKVKDQQEEIKRKEQVKKLPAEFKKLPPRTVHQALQSPERDDKEDFEEF